MSESIFCYDFSECCSVTRTDFDVKVLILPHSYILSKSQFGFRKNVSTETALANFIDYVHKGLTAKHNVGAIFMDLSQAFDVMDHNILEIKLKHYGFRGTFLKFLMSFVRNRKYFVNINGMNSNTRPVNIGVPQGSTLGPLLFLLYINDMKNCSSILQFTQFADDTTSAFSCKTCLTYNRYWNGKYLKLPIGLLPTS